VGRLIEYNKHCAKKVVDSYSQVITIALVITVVQFREASWPARCVIGKTVITTRLAVSMRSLFIWASA
jgi:hypothetical protein